MIIEIKLKMSFLRYGLLKIGQNCISNFWVDFTEGKLRKYLSWQDDFCIAYWYAHELYPEEVSASQNNSFSSYSLLKYERNWSQLYFWATFIPNFGKYFALRVLIVKLCQSTQKKNKINKIN